MKSLIRSISVDSGADTSLRLFFTDLDQLHADKGKGILKALSPETRERAARFRSDQLQNRFAASHYLLREAIGEFTGTLPEPELLAFQPFAKPEIPECGCHFNLSRSGCFAVVLISRKFPVGVDVEVRRETLEVKLLSRRVLSHSERQHLESLPEDHQTDAFLAYWRMKEAILKATGEGLSRDPREILLGGGRPPMPEALPPAYGHLEDWSTGVTRPADDFPEVAWAVRHA